MELTALQIDLLRRLRSAVEETPGRRVVYCSEWLGYLPYGLYHWVEADGTDISKLWLADWSSADLETLERLGFLAKVSVWQNPHDEWDEKVTYKVNGPQPRG